MTIVLSILIAYIFTGVTNAFDDLKKSAIDRPAWARNPTTLVFLLVSFTWLLHPLLSWRRKGSAKTFFRMFVLFLQMLLNSAIVYGIIVLPGTVTESLILRLLITPIFAVVLILVLPIFYMVSTVAVVSTWSAICQVLFSGGVTSKGQPLSDDKQSNDKNAEIRSYLSGMYLTNKGMREFIVQLNLPVKSFEELTSKVRSGDLSIRCNSVETNQDFFNIAATPVEKISRKFCGMGAVLTLLLVTIVLCIQISIWFLGILILVPLMISFYGSLYHRVVLRACLVSERGFCVLLQKGEISIEKCR